ncbi:MAG: DNA-directed RNA polymerase subunit beta, partial [Candidatus Shikimatogenerans sp. JK-2022]|nr:DNA-directed RNA polymerase subunit beta [Candidatus Shikimatogenerans bostrichidophilus]
MLNKKRIDFSQITKNIFYLDLLKTQINSYKNFLNLNRVNHKTEKLYKLFKLFFPIYNKYNKLKINFLKYYLSPPKYSVDQCRNYEITFGININIKLKITFYYKDKKINKIKKFYLCNCPYITNNGSFIFNGNERVVIYQLNRSPGLFLGSNYHYNGYKLYYVRIIPELGVWLEFQNDSKNFIYISIDKKKKILITTFLRALGYKTNEEIFEIFGLYKKIKLNKKNLKFLINRKYINNNKNKNIFPENTILDKNKIKLLIKKKIKYIYIKRLKFKKDINFLVNNIIKKDINKNYKDSITTLYKILKRSYPPNLKIAENFITYTFYNKKKYNLGKVGRYKLNIKLNLSFKNNKNYLTKLDIKKIIKNLIYLFNKKIKEDDIDNLENRQVKTVGDFLYNIFYIGLSRLHNIIKEKINIKENNVFNLNKLINSRILNSLLNTFFGTSPVCQYLDKTNPLSEMTHKRRVTLLGPGGLKKNRATFEARDVNNSHYGRLCPIETPEGPNIGLIY